MSERINDFGECPDELERQLSHLVPRASGVSRDRLMFLAGREAALREQPAGRRWSWPMATAASWLVTACFAGLWALSDDESFYVPIAENAPMETQSAAPSDQEPVRPLQPAAAFSQNDAPAEAEPSRRDDAYPSRLHPREPLLTIDSLLDGDDLPRLSMVGWQSLDRRRPSLAEAPSSSGLTEPVDVPPASYSRLMKVYLNDSAVSGTQGDLL